MDATRISRIEKWTWILIYGGLLSLGLGLFVLRGSDAKGMGWTLVLAGVAGVVAGVILVVLRSKVPTVPGVPKPPHLPQSPPES